MNMALHPHTFTMLVDCCKNVAAICPFTCQREGRAGWPASQPPNPSSQHGFNTAGANSDKSTVVLARRSARPPPTPHACGAPPRTLPPPLNRRRHSTRE
eukprot:366450-Chlamydomonas_euryale.AAC.13